MKYYRCLHDNINGRLTNGNVYAIKKNNKVVKEQEDGICMYIIDHYDDETEPGPLNDYWFTNFFKLVPNLSKNVRIL